MNCIFICLFSFTDERFLLDSWWICKWCHSPTYFLYQIKLLSHCKWYLCITLCHDVSMREIMKGNSNSSPIFFNFSLNNNAVLLRYHQNESFIVNLLFLLWCFRCVSWIVEREEKIPQNPFWMLVWKRPSSLVVLMRKCSSLEEGNISGAKQIWNWSGELFNMDV